MSLTDQGKLDEAKQLFPRALNIDEKNLGADRNVAHGYSNLGELQRGMYCQTHVFLLMQLFDVF